MKITSLQLTSFRNYASEKITFGDKLNVLSGENASGKTNMLEAVYLLGLGKSPRTAKEKEMIKFGCDRAVVRAEVKKKYRTHTVEIALEKSSKKILLDGIPIKRLSELIGIINVVYFSPDEMRFIKNGPDERRKFLDVSLSQQSKTYFKSLAKYNKILLQRNTLLKTENNNKNLASLLAIWDTGLAEVGANLISARKNYVAKLNESAAKTHFDLSGGKESLALSYETSVTGDSYDEIFDSLQKGLASSLEKDREMMFTTVGAHRDDIKILLSGIDARKYASQGQQRSVSLSVKIAELELFERETGETPILLLDDVLSELDLSRKEKLLSLANRTQTILTCTEFDFNPSNLSKQYKIKNGKISV